MTRLDLIIPRPCQSQNTFKHWSERAQERKGFIKDITALCALEGIRPSAPATKQRLTITRILGPGEHLYDDGNLAGGSGKQIQDALKHCGFYRDDSPRYLEVRYLQDASSRQDGPATRIRLEPA